MLIGLSVYVGYADKFLHHFLKHAWGGNEQFLKVLKHNSLSI
jgi:hypothetical protein